jgi:DNA repair protein RadD
LFLAQHEREAESGVGVTKAEDRPDWREVTTWDFARHEKSGKPPSFRIDYHGPEMRGMRGQSEWLPFESDSQWARSKAAQIWYDLGGDTPAPVTVDDALDRVEELTMPVKILVRLRDGFREVAARSRPEAPAPNWTEELGDEIPF